VLLGNGGRGVQVNSLRSDRELCQAKIKNLGVSSLRYENVRRLDVSVNDARRVSSVESVRNLNP
jgi:hypothetical protein